MEELFYFQNKNKSIKMEWLVKFNEFKKSQFTMQQQQPGNDCFATLNNIFKRIGSIVQLKKKKLVFLGESA